MNPGRLLPTNRLHVKLGSSNARGLIVHVKGITQELLLCLASMEALIHIFSMRWPLVSCKADKIPEPPYLTDMFTLLQHTLISITLSPFIREIIFHLLSQILRLLAKFSSTERLEVFLESSSSFLAAMKCEFFKLFEKEVSLSRSNAVVFVLNCNFEKVKFSSYFQALLDVILAALELRTRILGAEWNSKEYTGALWGTSCDAYDEDDEDDADTSQVICNLLNSGS